MDDKTFFEYYIPALEKALAEDHIDYGFMVKGEDWWVPDDLSIDMDNFAETHYDKYPVLEEIAYYFDARSHNFPNIEGVDIDDYKNNIQQQIVIIRDVYKIPSINFVPKRKAVKAHILRGYELMLEFPEDQKEKYINPIIEYLISKDPKGFTYTIEEMTNEYIILKKKEKKPKWKLSEIGLSDDIPIEK